MASNHKRNMGALDHERKAFGHSIFVSFGKTLVGATGHGVYILPAVVVLVAGAAYFLF